MSISSPFAAISGKKVLIVEDDPGSQAALAALFGQCEAQVTTVATAEDGVDAIQRDLPDLVVADIRLPGMDGYYFVQKLREFEAMMGAAAAPAIAVSSLNREADLLRAVGEGFQQHLTKPVAPQILLETAVALLPR